MAAMERRLKDLEYSMNEADEELLKMKKERDLAKKQNSSTSLTGTVAPTSTQTGGWFSSWLSNDPPVDEWVIPELNTPSTKEQYFAIAEEAVSELVKIFEEKKGWIPLDHRLEGVEIYEKYDEERPYIHTKSQGFVSASLDSIFNVILHKDEDEKENYEPDLLKLETIENFGNVTVKSASFYVGPMLSDRQFIFVQTTRNLPGGGKLVAQKSINYPSTNPYPDHVRGAIISGGVIVHPDQRAEGRCVVKQAEIIDLRGSIPSLAIAMNKTKSGQRIINLQEIAKRLIF